MMKLPTRSRVFLDTSYVIALSSPKDKYHKIATQLADQLEIQRVHFVTTRAVLLEIGNALSKQRFKLSGIDLLESIEADPDIEIIPMSELLYTQAFQLYQSRPDKEWGMTDCVSFVVMREQKLKEALTTDNHFSQAGYRALLLEKMP
jgi:predicted nucleic acid-binding protein